MGRSRSDSFYIPCCNEKSTEDLLKEIAEQELEKKAQEQEELIKQEKARQEYLFQQRLQPLDREIYPISEEEEEGYTDDEGDSLSVSSVELIDSNLKHFNSSSTGFSSDS